MVIADPRPDVVPEVLDETAYASWTARVVATVLDGLAFSGLGYLVAGPALEVEIIPPVTFGADGLADLAPGARTVLLAVVVLVLLLQGYGGATPGKRIVGVAVVDDQTGRPVGIARTVLRSLAHLLDAILLLGYLRPLWHAERRTFADSVMGTVVLRTRTSRSSPGVRGCAPVGPGRKEVSASPRHHGGSPRPPARSPSSPSGSRCSPAPGPAGAQADPARPAAASRSSTPAPSRRPTSPLTPTAASSPNGGCGSSTPPRSPPRRSSRGGPGSRHPPRARGSRSSRRQPTGSRTAAR
jgi:uncharacterized RDD family membrane protein YckC